MAAPGICQPKAPGNMDDGSTMACAILRAVAGAWESLCLLLASVILSAGDVAYLSGHRRPT